MDLNTFSNRKVCSNHFPSSSFIIKLKKKNDVSGRTKLKLNALPIEIEPTTAIITAPHSSSVSTQTDLDMILLTNLFDKLTLFEQNSIDIMICIERFQDDDCNIKYYTDFRTYKIFRMVFDLLEVSS